MDKFYIPTQMTKQQEDEMERKRDKEHQNQIRTYLNRIDLIN